MRVFSRTRLLTGGATCGSFCHVSYLLPAKFESTSCSCQEQVSSVRYLRATVSHGTKCCSPWFYGEYHCTIVNQKLVQVLQVGKLSYGNGLKLQNALVKLHHGSNKLANTLICVEHPPVYTTGIRTKDYTEAEEKRLRNMGAEFYRTNRGGLITFHGPGQLVVYPIINLKDFKPSMRWYVCHLEKTIISVCKKLGLDAETSPHTGVWIGDKKVCAIGVHGSRFITLHGLALNCNVDLKWFEHIVPCGIEGKGVTSLSNELQRNVGIDEILPVVIKSFSEVFECAYTNFPEAEAGDILRKIAL